MHRVHGESLSHFTFFLRQARQLTLAASAEGLGSGCVEVELGITAAMDSFLLVEESGLDGSRTLEVTLLKDSSREAGAGAEIHSLGCDS